MSASGLKQVNIRILSIVVFSFVCYLSIGLPLAVLPGFVHQNLQYSSFLAGLVISVQYFATLLSRPHAGRLADQCGPKRVVIWGLVCCALSGGFSILAAQLTSLPLLSMVLLCIGRLFLGVGESFAATGSTLWGIGVVGALHTGRVISWNGVATYGAMAIGAPLGAFLNHHGGLTRVATLVVCLAILAIFLAWGKPAISVKAGQRITFWAVLGRVWMHGLGLGFGTVGFGVIATFITLYYADMGWSGAAFSLTLFSLGFVGIRLILANSLGRYGGLKVSLCCFLVEIIGLLMIGIGHTVMLVACGAFLTGSGFSLIFPSLGVEAVRRVPQQNQGTALGTYSAFLDLGLGITGPIAGVMISHCGFASLYLAAALVVFLAWLITWRLLSLAD